MVVGCGLIHRMIQNVPFTKVRSFCQKGGEGRGPHFTVRRYHFETSCLRHGVSKVRCAPCLQMGFRVLEMMS